MCDSLPVMTDKKQRTTASPQCKVLLCTRAAALGNYSAYSAAAISVAPPHSSSRQDHALARVVPLQSAALALPHRRGGMRASFCSLGTPESISVFEGTHRLSVMGRREKTRAKHAEEEEGKNEINSGSARGPIDIAPPLSLSPPLLRRLFVVLLIMHGVVGLSAITSMAWRLGPIPFFSPYITSE